jgi:exonuclease III
MSVIKVISANVQGIQGKSKRIDVLNYFKDLNSSILCLQDIHLTQSDCDEISNYLNSSVYIAGNSTNSRGVLISIRKNIDHKIIKVVCDNAGNYIVLDLLLNNDPFRIINLYGPNSDSPLFFLNIRQLILEKPEVNIVICGDFNLTLNQHLDTYNYNSTNNPKAKQSLIETVEICNLTDIFRHMHKNCKQFTWRKKNPVKQARLDYFLLSKNLVAQTQSTTIKPGYRSDHSIIELNLTMSNIHRGKGLWKLNCSLLKNSQYVELINKVILDVKETYCLPVYNRDNLSHIPDEDIQFIIPDDLFLDTLLMIIRGETVKFSSRKKRETENLENKLIKEIEILEKKYETSNKDKLEQVKLELENIRACKMEGIITRSRLDYLKHREKPTKSFLSLEHKNYMDKTIRQLEDNKGNKINKQQEILKYVQNFYSDLYKSQDDNIEDDKIDSLIRNLTVRKLSNENSMKLDGKLKIEELSLALNNMKNNKTPGSDGFPCEFFKMFWQKIKFFVLRSLNNAYEKGSLSLTLRQVIMTLLPKGEKDKNLLKNWRPVSLLNTIYKIAATAIANRIKPFLGFIIAPTQTGFIKGRFIGETTRFIYDIMNYVEKTKNTGLLMLIDFEKAFDSISWKFLFKALRLFNVSEGFIKWIKILNKDILASVIQIGYLSEFFKIERGCKQGDPLAPYLFIICAEILAELIKQNKEIKGITIKNIEYKIIQYADDTTLLLDGTKTSLQETLNVLDSFYTISGLKINPNKTTLTWIGDKKLSNDKLKVSIPLTWNNKAFKLLGINFNINLNLIIQENVTKQMQDIQGILLFWQKQKLTVFGKITIIKTVIMSKLTHFFTSLPNPDEELVNKLQNMLFKFLWDNKPDKISRQQAYKPYEEGGLNMVNVKTFIHSLKITWLKRLINNDGSPWVSLFASTICSIDKLLKTGPLWYKNSKNCIRNNFWSDTFGAFSELCLKIDFASEENDILRTTISYNPLLKNPNYFNNNLYRNNVIYVCDIITFEGKMLSYNELVQIYNCPNFHVLDYFKLKNNVKDGIKHLSCTIQQPFKPKFFEVILNTKFKCGLVYKKLNYQTINEKYKQKWLEVLNLNEVDWSKYFTVCLSAKHSNSLIWFQYKIIFRILGTNAQRHKMKQIESPNCQHCNIPQDLIHMFIDCPLVKPIWRAIEQKLTVFLNYPYVLDKIAILLGYIKQDFCTPINFLLIATKHYIFQTMRKQKLPRISDLWKEIKTHFNFQTLVFQNGEDTNNVWHPLEQILKH